MIEQGRLRAWIDQPLHLLYFETRLNHETDADAQGTAGGLGVDRQEKEIEPVSWTERWDERIRATNIKVSHPNRWLGFSDQTCRWRGLHPPSKPEASSHRIHFRHKLKSSQHHTRAEIDVVHITTWKTARSDDQASTRALHAELQGTQVGI